MLASPLLPWEFLRASSYLSCVLVGAGRPSINLVVEESLKFPTKVKISKKKLHFFAWNHPSMPRGISWHHWKNLLTSKRGCSGGSNFSTEFDQIWLKTSGGSRELIFGPICKCHTILESFWHIDSRFLKLGGQWRSLKAARGCWKWKKRSS